MGIIKPNHITYYTSDTSKLNYIRNFEGTEMYNTMIKQTAPIPWKEIGVDLDDIMPLELRNKYKWVWSRMALAWFKDGAQVMIDIAHRQRYLENNPDLPMDFFDYVWWKYTNPWVLSC